MNHLSSNIVKSFFVLLFMAVTMPAFAANTLTSKSAEQFVSTLPDVTAMSKRMREEGKSDVMSAKTEPVPGQAFRPYSQAVSVLKKEFPQDYKQLTSIVKGSGFSSAEKWGETGNQVMMAYMATQMKVPPQKAMQQLSPEMMANMPKEAQEQMKKSLAVMQTISNVPQEHKDIVTPLVPSINAFIASESAQGASQ